jgi:hypothetical protein
VTVAYTSPSFYFLISSSLYRILMRKPEIIKSLGVPSLKQEGNIKLGIKGVG